MSEYQYYEFQAIDRPLTNKEMSALRSYSSRARITPTSFVNEYQWGRFKGDEDRWMESYFDAFLYLANWGTHILKLSLPSRLLDLKIAEDYCCGDSAFVAGTAEKVILSFVSEEEVEDMDWEYSDYLSSMISVRAELARGDLRALYLGWLLCVQSGELDDEEVEPPVPSGLGQLSASLESMADFLNIDRDLLEVAAQSSPSPANSRLERTEVQDWVATLPATEKDQFLTSIVIDMNLGTATELLQKFLKDRSANVAATSTPRRSVGELLRAAEASAEERQRIDAERRAKEKARRERETALERERHLDSMMGREPKLWADIETLIATRQPKKYDEAIKLLADLRDLDGRAGSGDFRTRMEALRHAHAGKPSLLERLKKAGQ